MLRSCSQRILSLLEELRRLQRFSAAKHEAAVLEDLKRIWKPRVRAAELGTANSEHCTRGCAAEAETLRRMHGVRAAEIGALGEHYNVPLDHKPPVFEADQDQVSQAGQAQGSQAAQADQAEGVSVGSSSSALVPGLGGGHFGCAAELEDLRRMQLFRDAEVRKAIQGDVTCFGRLKRTCSTELEDLRRMQSDLAVSRAAETEGAVTRAAAAED